MASKFTNKFTKSVLEREQKEQKNVENFAPATKNIEPPASLVMDKTIEPILLQQPTVPTAASTPVKQPATSTKSMKKPVEPVAVNLDAFLNPSENRQAKNKTFYLDTAVIDAIKQAATANHMAESKLVNDILKKVLNA